MKTLWASEKSKMAASRERRETRRPPRYNSPGDVTLEEEVAPVRGGGAGRRGPVLVGGVVETPPRRGGQRGGEVGAGTGQ